MAKYLLKLYVNNRTGRSQRAIDNLQQMLAVDFVGRYELEIIDVLEDPQSAESRKIIATPTLIRELPPPVRRIIGDLSDHHQVLQGLELERLPQDNGAGCENG